MIALDIETACAVVGCEEKGCKHPLDPFKNKITCIGVWDGKAGYVFRTLRDLDSYLSDHGYPKLVGHNLKFDLKNLYFHGLDLRDCYEEDTQLLGSLTFEKIPEFYLLEYELQRAIENEELPKGYSHRQAGALSLKVMAPFYLNVPAFWENPANHDNDDYVLKDCRYTYDLANRLKKDMPERVQTFYHEWLMPKVRMLLDMEIRGISIDLVELERQDSAAKEQRDLVRQELEVLWKAPFDHYKERQSFALIEEYGAKKQIAIERLKIPKLKDQAKALNRYHDKIDKCELRYSQMTARALSAIEPFNLNSPKQLAWLFKDYYNLDIENFEGDESTGRSVLNRLANEGREDIKKFLEYRKLNKLVTSFFPTYRDLHKDGVIHCSFNPTGTRTGRLSSSDPNLQQVPGELHKLFIARPGYKLAAYDLAGIEARLIAYVTEDPALNEILRSGKDFHSINTKIFFNLNCPWEDIKEQYPNQRAVAKNCIFALFYGAGSRRIQETALAKGYDWNIKKCKKIYDRIRDTYAGVWKFKEEIDKTLARGPIYNLFGRPVYIPNQDEIFMKGFNSFVQGSASDLMLESAEKISSYFHYTPLLLVHDELITEVMEESEPNAKTDIIRCMTDYEFINKHGRVAIEVEGNVSREWKK